MPLNLSLALIFKLHSCPWFDNGGHVSEVVLTYFYAAGMTFDVRTIGVLRGTFHWLERYTTLGVAASRSQSGV